MFWLIFSGAKAKRWPSLRPTQIGSFCQPSSVILAASAEAEHAELKTLNLKHYPMFKSLKPAYKK
jgi:hypothetical protein